MAHVNGIGGFFFEAENPDLLNRWYAEHLGISPPPQSYDEPVWEQAAGPTVFAPFAREQGEGSPVGAHGWGINLRVDDLEAILDELRRAGIEVSVDPELYPIGRFAQLYDPEGNAVQLWEPSER